MEDLEIRRIVTYKEDRYTENGRTVTPTTRLVAVIAVIKNPWYGRGFVENLQPEIDRFAPVLGTLLSERAIEELGGVDGLEAFGKAAMVGVDGEIEHAAGLVHTLKFGNPYRELTGATRLLNSTDKRGGPGAGIDIPLRHITRDDARDHYQNFEVRIPDAPRGDEILICLAASTGGRPHPRIGSRVADERELGLEPIVSASH